LRRRDAAQFFQRHHARARISLTVLKQLMRPVRAYGDGVKFERETGGVEFRVQVAGFLRFLHGGCDATNPFVHDFGDAVAHDAEAAIEFKRCRGEEAAALENSFFDENQPVIDQSPQTRHAFWRGDRRQRHLIDKNLARHFNGRQLQFFLRAKVGEEAALAHAQLLGKGADGKALQALRGGDIHGASEYSFASAKAFGLAAEDRLADGVFDGTGAENARHSNNVTQSKNKHERSFIVLRSFP
jgi:hypothetical protein